MAEQATRRQRSDEMTLSERHPQGLERYRQSRFLPSVFSVSPGEFFTLSPITLMKRLTEDIDRAVSGLGMGMSGSSEHEFTWAPPVEVRQSGNNLIVRADLPGLNENDIKLEATEEGLILQGERQREEEHQEGGLYRSERVYGQFYRFIPLPEGTKTEQIKANFKNGVLEVMVPVPESAQNRRQVPISTQGPAQSRAATSGSSR